MIGLALSIVGSVLAILVFVILIIDKEVNKNDQL